MKNFVRFVLILASLLSFSTFAQAQGKMVKMEGKGNTETAIKEFNKAVASNEGTVDRNAQTEYSSAGTFLGKYQAKIYVEEKGKNSVNIKISVVLLKSDLISFLTVQKNTELEIITKIYESLEKVGYKGVVNSE